MRTRSTEQSEHRTTLLLRDDPWKFLQNNNYYYRCCCYRRPRRPLLLLLLPRRKVVHKHTHTDTKRQTQIYLLLRNAIVLSVAALTATFKGIASVFYTSIKETVLSVRVLVALQAIETNTHPYKHKHTQRFAFGRTIDKDDKRFTGEFHSI